MLCKMPRVVGRRIFVREKSQSTGARVLRSADCKGRGRPMRTRELSCKQIDCEVNGSAGPTNAPSPHPQRLRERDEYVNGIQVWTTAPRAAT